jgi:hypothetical protein
MRGASPRGRHSSDREIPDSSFRKTKSALDFFHVDPNAPAVGFAAGFLNSLEDEVLPNESGWFLLNRINTITRS